MGDATTRKTATIANGASLSGEIELGNSTALGLSLPTLTSAALTFQVAESGGGTYRNLYDDAGTEVTIPASTGDRWVALPPALFSGARALKIRSGTAAAPVNQGADRAILVISRPVG